MQTLRLSKPVAAMAIVAAIALAVIGYLAVRSAGVDSTEACDRHIAQIQEEQRELLDELGADAPIYDFYFPASCFD